MSVYQAPYCGRTQVVGSDIQLCTCHQLEILVQMHTNNLRATPAIALKLKPLKIKWGSLFFLRAAKMSPTPAIAPIDRGHPGDPPGMEGGGGKLEASPK